MPIVSATECFENLGQGHLTQARAKHEGLSEAAQQAKAHEADDQDEVS